MNLSLEPVKGYAMRQVKGCGMLLLTKPIEVRIAPLEPATEGKLLRAFSDMK